MASAFGAGFAKGFGTGIAEGIETRRAERNKYLDLAIDNAKRVAPAYAQSEAEISQMEDMMTQMGNDFGITPEEFIGIAQNYNVNDIYKNVYTAKAVMEKNNIKGQIDKTMILGSLQLPDQFKLPKDVTPEKALRMIFQGVTNYTDPNNKSEAHRAGAFGKAVAEILQLNPRATAEDMASAMQIAGVPVDKLMAFQATGGLKQKPFSDLVASGPYQNIDIDYDTNQFKSTTSSFASVFSRMFAGTDDPTNLAALLSRNPKALSAFGPDATAEAVYAEVFSAGQTMARLEKALIAKGLGVGFGQANARYDAMSGVAQRLESVAEMNQLVKLIESDTSVADRIVEVYGNDQMITDKEMDYILTGKRSTSSKEPEETTTTTPKVEEPTVTPKTEEQTIAAFSADQEARLAGEDAALPAGIEPTDQMPALGEVPTRDVPEMEGSPRLPKDIISEDTLFSANARQIALDRDIDMTATGAANRAAQLEVFQEAFKPQMKQITHAEWKKLDRKQRRERGLPESNFDVALYGGGSRNFKDGRPWFEGFTPPKDGPAPGDERSRLDAEGKVKPKVAAQEDKELFTDIDASIIEQASEDLPTFNSVFDAEKYAKKWLKDNIPDYEDLGYDPIVIARTLLLAYGNEGTTTDTKQKDTASPEVSSLVDDILKN